MAITTRAPDGRTGGHSPIGRLASMSTDYTEADGSCGSCARSWRVLCGDLA